ncbi:hypothetical protein ASG87_01340 [Frateuria sp. Soil773]|uniref:integrase family protein n=1 Tax=Frateuria sp. Soil773 TaxID=1736407 RepID=UPI0006F483B1|nr:integrase family protein [Frateuria sp. Soil773]KRE90807.1 hypothetical protein ASG87_01340 [Frateuria sp. Soil773]
MAVQLELSQKLVDSLTFENRIVGVSKTGQYLYEKTPPDETEWTVRDGGKTGVSGLILRIHRSTKTWAFRRKWGGKSRRVKMSSADVMSLALARQRARAWQLSYDQGHDPQRLIADHRDETLRAEDQRRLTVEVAMQNFIEYKRKHKTKLGDDGRLDIGVGKRRKVDPKLRDSSTEDRIKVQRWLTGSPMWRVSIVQLTEAQVAESLTPLLHLAAGKKTALTWGPKSVSKGTMDKIYVHLDGAWWRAAKQLKLGVLREEGPIQTWRQSHNSDWPGDKRVEKALDTTQDAHIVWLKALLAMQTAAHDPAVLANRPDPRSKAIKPHLSVLIDFYLILTLFGTRQTETMLLQWPQVDFTKGLVWLSDDTTKSGAQDVIPLTPWARDILVERKRLNELWRPDEPGTFVFPSREHGRPINSPRSVLVALAEATGITITAHDLRRSLAREIGSEADLLRTAKLLVSGAALHHGAGRGGSKVAGATQRYLPDQAEILRPLYQQREDRLRQLVGLPVAAKPEKDKSEARAMIEKVKNDPALREDLIKALLGT